MCNNKTSKVSGTVPFEDLQLEDGWEFVCVRSPKVGETVYVHPGRHKEINNPSKDLYLIIKKSAWKPAKGDTCYRVFASGEVNSYDNFGQNQSIDACVWATNQLFNTREAATEAGRRIQALLRAYKKEIGEI